MAKGAEITEVAIKASDNFVLVNFIILSYVFHELCGWHFCCLKSFVELKAECFKSFYDNQIELVYVKVIYELILSLWRKLELDLHQVVKLCNQTADLLLIYIKV